MIHHTMNEATQFRKLTFRSMHGKRRALYPWEIPEVQEIDDTILSVRADRDSLAVENEDDDEPGWGALLQATLRDFNPSRAA